MKLACKELLYEWKRYILISIITVLLMFMVLSLSGLVSGLGSAVSSSLDKMNVTGFVLSDDSEDLLTVSKLSEDEFQEIDDAAGGKATPVDVMRMYLTRADDDEKLDVTYIGIDPDGFVSPAVYEGAALSGKNNEIVLDDDFEAKGIAVGDTVKDPASEFEFTVAGFADGSMYGHVSAAYVSLESFDEMMAQVNPAYQPQYHAAAVQGELPDASALPEGLMVSPKADVINDLPGYQAEQMTIQMVIWLLVAITALIIGIFFFVINIQKKREFGVMKALGISMGRLSRFVLAEVLFIAVAGTAVADVLVAAMAVVLPQTMPFTLATGDVLAVNAAFIIVSVLGGLASVASVANVDPQTAIGGAE